MLNTRTSAASNVTETSRLFDRYRQTRSHDDRNRLVEIHLSLAEQIARDYHHRGVEGDDLQQVALLALVKAVERFDPEFGARFSAFASVSINGEVKRYFRDHGWSVRPPRRTQEAHLNVRRATDELTVQVGRVPTAREVAAYLGCTVDEVLEAMAATDAYRADGLDAPSAHDECMTIGQSLGAEDGSFEHALASESMRISMSNLPLRDQEILRMRFWEARTQSDIAAVIGVSQMHVSRLLRKILDDLRPLVSDDSLVVSMPPQPATSG